MPLIEIPQTASRVENMTGDVSIHFRWKGILVDSRPFNVAELSSFDFNLGIAFLGCIANFTSDVLPFPITIRPNEQGSAVLSLLFDILGDITLVLRTFSATLHKCIGTGGTYI